MVAFLFKSAFTWCTTASRVDPPTHFLVTWLVHKCNCSLPHNTGNFVLVSTAYYVFAILHMFEVHLSYMSGHVSFLVLHLFAISLSISVHSRRLSRAISRLVGGCICWLHDLPHLTDIFVLASTENWIFSNLFMFEFKFAWICFTPMFHLFPIFPSRSAPIGLYQRPWTTIQKCWLPHLGVQEQSKFLFACWDTFMFIWPS